MSVTKRDLKLAERCPRLLWYHQRTPRTLDPVARMRMDTGMRVGELARLRYPGGVLLPNHDGLGPTKAAMAGDSTVLFEASFEFGPYFTRVDVLERVTGGWRLTEWKSGTSSKSEYAEEAFFQAWLLEQCGVQLVDVCVGFVNSEYVWDGGDFDPIGMLKSESILDKRAKVMPKVEEAAKLAAGVLAGEPDGRLARHCFRPGDCDYLAECQPEAIEATIFHIPGVDWRKADKMVDAGVIFTRDVLDTSELKEITTRTIRAIESGVPDIDDGLVSELEKIKFPALFLDFETIAPGFPLIPGTRPYESIPFQWSGHILTSPDEWEHAEFLAEGPCGARELFVESLLPLLRESQTIVHYSPFEKSQLAALDNRAIPGAEECYNLVIQRQFDLEKAIKENVFHPGFKGKSSIKVTLPTLVPGLDYKHLNIQDGQLAQVAFLRMIDPEIGPEERAKLREDLLAYCKLDTEAMVRIFHALKAIRF